jgi:hypothetical protein
MLLVRGDSPPKQPSDEDHCVYVVVDMSPDLPEPYSRGYGPAFREASHLEYHIRNLLWVHGDAPVACARN